MWLVPHLHSFPEIVEVVLTVKVPVNTLLKNIKWVGTELTAIAIERHPRDLCL